MTTAHKSERKMLAITGGDPAGVGPELLARAIERCVSGTGPRLLIIAAEEELKIGFEHAQLTTGRDELMSSDNIVWRELSHFLNPGVGVVSSDAGRWALGALRVGLDSVIAGDADGLVFAPLNKASLHAAGMEEYDEMRWFEKQLAAGQEVSELNATAGLWTSRVTSHVPLREVPSLITKERIIAVTHLLSQQMIAAGFNDPKIAVCALNPHAGEGGLFGSEEIDVIAPAVQAAAAEGLNVEGPFPADTLFVTANRRGYQGIVTMFHDQGQLALKSMGFAGGVTIEAGLGFAIATPAHGTAFDIAGMGVADTSSIFNAIDITSQLCGAP